MKKRTFSSSWTFLTITFSFIVLGGLSVWLGPYLLSKSVNPSKREQVETYTRNIWIESFKTSGGLAFVFTAYFAWRNLKATEQKQITDRLSKAIEQIGSEVPTIQIGGIYCLKRLAEDSLDRDYFIVIDVLSELLRSSSVKPNISRHNLVENFYKGDASSQDVKNLKPEAISRVLQVILEVLSDLRDLNPSQEKLLNLRRLNLWGANLKGRNLAHTDFSESILSQVNAIEADLRKCNFHYAILCPGPEHFNGRITPDSRNTWMERTKLDQCNFEISYMCYGVVFNEASLRKANFRYANAEETFFTNCNLQEACFHGAKLRNSSFVGSDLKNTDFQNSDIAGADFSRCQNMTESQIKKSKNWESAKLPSYLQVIEKG